MEDEGIIGEDNDGKIPNYAAVSQPLMHLNNMLGNQWAHLLWTTLEKSKHNEKSKQTIMRVLEVNVTRFKYDVVQITDQR